jgi:predicted DNA-binding antitoxin AbrB/MazE fold protein
MSRTIPAVFDSGVFRPLEPVELAQGTPVEVQVPVVASRDAIGELTPEELARQKAAIAVMLKKIEALPIVEPDDGFSGCDHDKIPYGKS